MIPLFFARLSCLLAHYLLLSLVVDHNRCLCHRRSLFISAQLRFRNVYELLSHLLDVTKVRFVESIDIDTKSRPEIIVPLLVSAPLGSCRGSLPTRAQG